jgi:hypothetical protein
MLGKKISGYSLLHVISYEHLGARMYNIRGYCRGVLFLLQVAMQLRFNKHNTVDELLHRCILVRVVRVRDGGELAFCIPIYRCLQVLRITRMLNRIESIEGITICVSANYTIKSRDDALKTGMTGIPAL